MQYRELGSLGKVSLLGMGIMRIPAEPTAEGGERPIQAITDELVKTCIENGVNYFDTARPIMTATTSALLASPSPLTGKRLSSPPSWPWGTSTNTPITCGSWTKSLERLQTDHIDVYLMQFWSEAAGRHAGAGHHPVPGRSAGLRQDPHGRL